VDPDSVAGVIESEATTAGAQLTTILDVTFVHPGPHLNKALVDVPDPSAILSWKANEKVSKYRGAANVANASGGNQLVFIPIVLSVMGRMDPIAQRFVDMAVNSAAINTHRPLPMGGTITTDESSRQRALSIRRTRCTLSTTAMRSLISAMFTAADAYPHYPAPGPVNSQFGRLPSVPVS
jgi:hypothetical protein